jgi:hypothetical protein
MVSTKKSKKFSKEFGALTPIIIGAILTAVAFVIAHAWGLAIQKSISYLVDKVRCTSKYGFDYSDKEYKECIQEQSILGLYINAFATSIFLYGIISLLFGMKGLKNVKKWSEGQGLD